MKAYGNTYKYSVAFGSILKHSCVIFNLWNTKGYPNQKDSKSVPNTLEHLRQPLTKEFLNCSKSVPRFFGTSKAILNKRVPKVFLKNSLIDTKSVPRNPVNPMQQEVSQTCHYETRNVVSSLGISLMTLRRTVSLLREVLGTQIFDKEFGDRGYSEKTLYCLQLYFEYRRQGAGRERAAKYVKQQIEQQQQNAQKQPA